jgi:hypothetical protein
MTHEESSQVTCHACGARFDRKAWSMLALVERIEPNEVRRMLVDWPNEHCIEIRRCRRCAREVPAKRDAPPSSQSLSARSSPARPLA